MIERWQVTIAPDMDGVREFNRRFGVTPAVIGYGDTPAEALADARAAVEAWCDGAAAISAAAADVAPRD